MLDHPSNPKEPKAPQKGKRSCFIAAIEYYPNTDESKLISNSYWAFCPTMKNDRTEDYHKVCVSSNYLKWFTENRIPNLNNPSLIILDNAKYSKPKPQDTPRVSKLKNSRYCLNLQKTALILILIYLQLMLKNY